MTTNDYDRHTEDEIRAETFWLDEMKLYRFGEANQTLETALELKTAIDKLNSKGQDDAEDY